MTNHWSDIATHRACLGANPSRTIRRMVTSTGASQAVLERGRIPGRCKPPPGGQAHPHSPGTDIAFERCASIIATWSPRQGARRTKTAFFAFLNQTGASFFTDGSATSQHSARKYTDARFPTPLLHRYARRPPSMRRTTTELPAGPRPSMRRTRSTTASRRTLPYHATVADICGYTEMTSPTPTLIENSRCSAGLE
jgi:hypothetical protein